VPGGRMDLQPEKSRNLDGSIGYQYTGKFQFEGAVSTYYYNVDNWIMWVPGPLYWVPENVRKVDAYGFEISSNIHFKTWEFLHEVSGNYGFTRSVVIESAIEDDIGVNNQLPYTPISVAGVEYRGIIKNWFGSLAGKFTGARFVTADNESTLPSYFLLDFRAGKNIYIKKQRLNINFRINNLLNVSYQNMNFRAMPGRNYMLGINFMFNK
jgi:iron complex outermembrane receptor protein